MSSFLLLMVLLISCSTSKKTTQNVVEKDKSTTNLEQKIEEQKNIISLFTIDTTINTNLLINIIEKETTTIDTAGNIKIEKEKQTNISNKKEQKGLTNNKVEDKSNNKKKTVLKQKNDTYKEVRLTTSTKTKANMNWLYWVVISIITVIVLYFSRSWVWKLIKKLLRL